ncbi:MAG: hypothetical protein AAB510_02065 [Patescibacteria group bacterium]
MFFVEYHDMIIAYYEKFSRKKKMEKNHGILASIIASHHPARYFFLERYRIFAKNEFN